MKNRNGSKGDTLLDFYPAFNYFTEKPKGAENNEYEDEDGDGYYEIYTADELDAFSLRVNFSSAYRHLNAELMADIVYNEGIMTADSSPDREWIPIGSSTQQPFRGKFLGNNKSISGLYFNSTDGCAGLFGYVNGIDNYIPHIENVIVKNSYFHSGDYCGAIAARFQNRTGATMINCASINNIIDNAGRSSCGGVVGYNQGTIKNCYSTSTVIGSSYVGGIVGQQTGTVSNCYYLEGTCKGGVGGSNITGQAEAKTAEQFASGEVAYKLQGSQTTHEWGQTIGVDPLPLLGDDKVYYTNLTCADDSPMGYSNTLDRQHVYETVVTPPTPYTQGYTTHTCSGCGHSYTDSYIKPTNVGGDAELFDKLTPQSADLIVSPSYAIDEAIYITASNGVWVGLYPSTVTTPQNKADAIYTYQLESKAMQCFDMRTGSYNPSNSSAVRDCLNMGETYTVFLFADSGYTVSASASFIMTAGNEVKVNDATYLQTDKKTYTYGETMLLNANAANNPYAWVGVYPKGSANSTTPAEYFIQIGSSQSVSHAGQTVDIINTSRTNNGTELLPGDYDVCLFGDRTMDIVLAKLTISVRTGYISTDKETYGYGERIIAKSGSYKSENVDVSNTAKVHAAAKLYTDASTTSNYYTTIPASSVVTVVGTSGLLAQNNRAKVSYGGNTGYIQASLAPIKGSDVKIYGYIETEDYILSAPNYVSSNYIKKMPVGTAYTFLEYYSDRYILAQVEGYVCYLDRVSSTNNKYLSTAYVAHNNSDVSATDGNAWVGLYDKGITPSADAQRTAWYSLNAFPAGIVTLQDLAFGDGTTYAGSASVKAGEHTLTLFGNQEYSNIIDSTNFTVSNKVTGSFKKGAYKVIDLNDGFANGTIALDGSLGTLKGGKIS
ncbi:MAG: hypothetical protein II225_03505, partial [Ruminococcus sp.]|nr:hypothetical protein [Ruminococcus sp.]